MEEFKYQAKLNIPFVENPFGQAELAERLKPAFALQEKLAKEQIIPGGVLAVGNINHVVYGAAGLNLYGPQAAVVKEDTLYDLASLTKLFTGFMAMQMLERGLYRLHDPVSLFLPEFQRSDKEHITIYQLLTHTSGLSPHQEFFRNCDSPESMLAAIAEFPLAYATGTEVAYSCLGFITLAQALAKILGLSFDEYLQINLFQPLQMKDTCFNPKQEKARIAATEQSDWDNRLCWGAVHDENARCQGGISGNAGLFSTAEDLSKFAQMYLNQGSYKGLRLLSPLTVQNSIINRTAGLGGQHRGLAWHLKDQGLSFMGDLATKNSFGHTGFTGTSMLISPELGIFVLWLTNRVHPSRKEERLLRYRSLMHNLILAALV